MQCYFVSKTFLSFFFKGGFFSLTKARENVKKINKPKNKEEKKEKIFCMEKCHESN